AAFRIALKSVQKS
nr:Chain V, THE ANAPHASE-PROMOTING COMPLEX CHAIN V [Homo sapiens]